MTRYSEEIIEDLHHEIDGMRTDFKYIFDLVDEVLAGLKDIHENDVDLSEEFDKLRTIKSLCRTNQGSQ